MSMYLFTLRSFLVEAASVFTFPGSSLVKKFILWSSAAVLVFFGFKATDHLTFTLSGSELGIAITIVLFAMWTMIGIGYGIAKAHRAKIIVDRKLIVSEEHASIRIPVSVSGYGKANVKSTVLDVRDINGNSISASDAPGLPLEWTYNEHIERLQIDQHTRGASVSLFSVIDTVIRLHGVRHQQIIDHFEQSNEIWVHVQFDSEGCGVVREWFGVRRKDASCRIKVEPIDIETEKPVFCN